MGGAEIILARQLLSRYTGLAWAWRAFGGERVGARLVRERDGEGGGKMQLDRRRGLGRSGELLLSEYSSEYYM